jgi:nucleotide-binding universal stress UspA family protein
MPRHHTLGTAASAAVHRLVKSGLSARPVIEHGVAKNVLLAQANQHHADLLFVGAKGRSAMERFLIGSTSAAIASRAACSVEIVRPKISL